MTDNQDSPVSEAPREAPPQKPRARLTVVEMVYYQAPGEQPESYTCNFCRELLSEEQPYQRKKLATEEWKPLDFGWVDVAGQLVITNDEGKNRQVTPSPEELAVLAEKVIQVSTFATDFYWKVPPGESMRAYPSDHKLFIRCTKGTARYTITVIPE